MEKFLFLVLFAVGANCFYINNGTTSKDKIVGGVYTTITEVPYQAQIINDGDFGCGAAIISSRWLITAAHCFLNESNPNAFVITGSSYRAKGRQNKITDIIVHEGFDLISMDNDICLIKVKNPIRYNKSQKKITISRVPPKTGQRVKISGFGDEGTDIESLPLVKGGYIPVIDHDYCVNSFRYDTVTDNMFCTDSSVVDTCQGDSGGPVVYDDELVGVVSWGLGCQEGYPGVYTQVANYIDWINAKSGLHL